MFLEIASLPLGARRARENTTLPSVMLIAANLITLPSVILSSSQPKSLAHPIGSGPDPAAACINRVQLLATSVLTTYGPCLDSHAVIHNASNSHISLEVYLLLDSGS